MQQTQNFKYKMMFLSTNFMSFGDTIVKFGDHVVWQKQRESNLAIESVDEGDALVRLSVDAVSPHILSVA
jgi:hypothetical protein